MLTVRVTYSDRKSHLAHRRLGSLTAVWVGNRLSRRAAGRSVRGCREQATRPPPPYIRRYNNDGGDRIAHDHHFHDWRRAVAGGDQQGQPDVAERTGYCDGVTDLRQLAGQLPGRKSEDGRDSCDDDWPQLGREDDPVKVNDLTEYRRDQQDSTRTPQRRSDPGSPDRRRSSDNRPQCKGQELRQKHLPSNR